MADLQGTALNGSEWRILVGDVRERLADLPDESVHCVVTSPPYYGLRDYGCDGQIGLEPTPDEFVAEMVAVFREVRRVLRSDGVCWMNLGDSYAGSWGAQGHSGQMADRSVVSARQIAAHPQQVGHTGSIPKGSNLKPKDLMGMPWQVAFALRADGWWLRSDVIWGKTNPMPSSVTDRCTTAHEYVFMLAKSKVYASDMFAIRQGGAPVANLLEASETRNCRDVWRIEWGIEDAAALWEFMNAGVGEGDLWMISTQGFGEAHFATYTEELVRRCIKAGTSPVGCCATCGAPRTRVLEKTRRPTRPGERTKIKVPGAWDLGEGGHGTIHRDGRTEATYRDTTEVGNRDAERHTTTMVSKGFEPTCDCDTGDPVPCVVLDPFLGSGTTVKVAIALGHHGIGCELNPEYAEIAERRITGRVQVPETVEESVPTLF